LESSQEDAYKYSILVNNEISGGMTPVRKQFSSLLQKKKKKIDNQFQHMIIDLVIQAGEYKCILEMWRSRKRRVNLGGVVTHIFVKFVSFNTTGGNGTLMMLALSNLQQQCQEPICQVKNLEKFRVCLRLQTDLRTIGRSPASPSLARSSGKNHVCNGARRIRRKHSHTEGI
jgi:hypothetical protein